MRTDTESWSLQCNRSNPKMRTKKEILDNNKYWVSSMQSYESSKELNGNLLLEVLCDIRDQLEENTKTIKKLAETYPYWGRGT